MINVKCIVILSFSCRFAFIVKKPIVMASKKITEILGDKAENLMNHKCIIDKSTLTLPSPDYIDETFVKSNRNNRVVQSMQMLMSHGRLADTGYCSIFPVDQGIEHLSLIHISEPTRQAEIS